MLPMTVAMAAPAISQPKARIMMGSRITFTRLPSSWPIIALSDWPSARMTLE